MRQLLSALLTLSMLFHLSGCAFFEGNSKPKEAAPDFEPESAKMMFRFDTPIIDIASAENETYTCFVPQSL